MNNPKLTLEEVDRLLRSGQAARWNQELKMARLGARLDSRRR